MEHLRRLHSQWSAAPIVDADRLIVWGVGALLWLICTISILFLPFAITIAVPIAVLAALIVLRYPMPSLIGFLVARMTVDLMWWVPGGLGLNFMEVFTGGITVLIGILCIRHFDELMEHPYLPAVGLWTTLLLLGAVQQPESRVVAELLARFLSPMLLMLLISIHFRRNRDRRQFMGWLLLAGILPILIGFFYWATGQAQTLQLSGYNRLSGGYSNIADHGLSMYMFATLGLFWLWTQRTGWKATALSAYILGALTLLILTYTRTPLVAFAVFVPVFLHLNGSRSLVIFAVAVAVVLLATNATLQDRFSDFVDFFSVEAGHQLDRLGSGRLGIWRRSFEAYLSQPFLQILVGNGLNSQYILAGDGQDSHSDYLSLLFQVGPIGLLIWLGIQVDMVRRAWVEHAHAQDAWTRTLLVSAIALATAVFISNILSNAYLSRVTMSWFWWSMVGLVLAIEAERKATERASQAT